MVANIALTAKSEKQAERRCIACAEMVLRDGGWRFVAAPDGTLVPDLAAKLPGRGAWLHASADCVARAFTKKLFARALQQQVIAGIGEQQRLADALQRRVVQLLALARRAGAVIAGDAKVSDMLQHHAKTVAFRIEANDGSVDGKLRLDRLAPEVPCYQLLSRHELAQAFDREQVVHLVIKNLPIAVELRRAITEFLAVTPVLNQSTLSAPDAGCQATGDI